jgi:hypothetical protein
MAELPLARVCHFTSGRLRLKIPEKRRDDSFFKTVAERLAGWDSVDRVEVNPLTASVLVHFSDVAALFADNALRNDLFAVDYDALEDADGAPALTERAARLWSGADVALRRWTGGAADIRSTVFLVLLAGGIYQLLRGNIAAPAATLLWYAGATLRLWDVAPQPDTAAAEPPIGEG